MKPTRPATIPVTPPRVAPATVTLRGLDEDDVTPEFVAALNDSDITRYMAAGRVPQTRTSAREFLRGARAGGGVVWAVCAEGAHVGNALLRVDWPRGVGDVGVLIWKKATWNQGHGRAAVRLVTAYAFEALALRRLTFWTHNPAAVRVVEALGWVREGTLRQDARLGGAWRDAVLYGLLREEWTP